LKTIVKFTFNKEESPLFLNLKQTRIFCCFGRYLY